MDNSVKFYQGNKNLKGANQALSYTYEQIEEIKKCIQDPIYFAKNYVKIVHVDRGLINFEMWQFQEEMISSFANNRFCIGKLPRQCGKTQTAATFILWYILFNQEKTVAVLANKGSTAREILSRVKLSFEGLPLWLQQGVVEWNKGSISLSNGCRVVAAASSSSAIRGMSISLLYLDEFAFLPPNQAMEFFESVYPTISSGTHTKIIMTSTPKGMNHFYKFWVEASEGRSRFVPFEITWDMVPGRDESFKKETIDNIGEDSWSQEYECDFIGSAGTLIAPRHLKKMVFKVPLLESNKWKFYEEPQKEHRYVITCDTSEGVGGDHHGIHVIDITEYPYRQVAVFRDNLTSPLMLPEMLNNTGRRYNDASILIEVQSAGMMVASTLWNELEYENVLFVGQSGQKGQILEFGTSSQRIPGIKTTKAVKKIGCSGIKDLIENGKLILNDYDTIEEFSVFIRHLDTFRAEEGYHDDLAMGMVLFGWLQHQNAFKELATRDLRDIFRERAEMFENEMLGFGSTTAYEDDVVEQFVDHENGVVWSVFAHGG